MSLMSNLQFTVDTFQVAIPKFFEIKIFSDAIGVYVKEPVVYKTTAVTVTHFGATK